MHRRRSAHCTWNLCTNTKADHDGKDVAQSRVLFHDKRSLHVMKRGRFVSAIIACTPVKYTSPWTRDAMLPKSVMVTIRERGELLLDMGMLDGKVALISGGGRGQGASGDPLFAQEGGSVVVGDILDEAGRRV